MKDTRRTAVSTTIFAATAIVLIVIAAVGFGLYATTSAKTSTSTSTTTTTAISTTTLAPSGTRSAISGGFINSQTVVFGYNENYTCTPSIASLGLNASESNTSCEVGAGNASAVSGALPVFVLVPAYAGLSIFGVPALGATSQGYPVFDNQTIVTDCGAGGSNSSCPFHPTYIYSPDFTAVEQHLNITNGVFGLPEGVLPTPAHDHVVGYIGNQYIPWYMVTVLVFDPNIMPNAITGQCTQVVQSNLANPTGNCLNSISAIEAALNTNSSATASANTLQSNPIYQTFGGVTAQVLIPGVTMVAESSPANSNLFLYFNVVNGNPLS
ncbi:MAG: hypothetical protein OK456_09035 [Thaumarchaeota archaeon]|nr:hypothetical protein [Nitrososphaerota archaeon]